jgi:hypothetical protein
MFAAASGTRLDDDNRVRNWPAGGYFLGPNTPAPWTPGENPEVQAPFPINYLPMEPYQYLMFHTYAGGNNGGWNALDFTFASDNHGMMSDAYCYAGRVDVAVLPNLNVWGSYIWAHRLEPHGTYLGQYQSSGSLCAGSVPNAQAFYNAAGRTWGTGDDYVSDGYIGWEANAGFDLVLLSSSTLSARYAYWEPGPYFREAYQSVVIGTGGQVITTGMLDSRDPIQAVEGTLTVSF